MTKYINGGIVKEITVFLKAEEELVDVLAHLGEYLDLNLYDMNVMDNAVFFEIKDSYLKEHFIGFLEELQTMQIPSLMDYTKKIQYIQKHFDDNMDDIIENCDDLFFETFRERDTFSLQSLKFHIEVSCYVFYFDGPFEGGKFESLLCYMHYIQKEALKNPLRGALCFGLSA